MNPPLDAALGYAARGIPVYPAHWPPPTPVSYTQQTLPTNSHV
jgi:hypothetical protein